MDISPSTADTWSKILVDAARDLDLTDPEDRSTFRYIVTKRTAPVTVIFIRKLAASYGVHVSGNCSRGSANYALTEGWMSSNVPSKS